jgi:hypothetical protein
VRSVALPAGAPLARGSEACAGPGGAGAPTRTAIARRPGLAAFLRAAAALFEVGVFTAGSRAYAEPVLDALDPEGELFAWRLYRDACVRVPVAAAGGAAGSSPPSGGGGGSCSPAPAPTPSAASSVFVVKDLKRLGRPLSRTLLVDNSPTCYAYQVSNGVPVRSWKGGHRDYDSSPSPPAGAGAADGSDHAAPPRSPDPEDGDTALLDLLPLLERAAAAPDVRPLIEAAFPAAAAAAAAARAHPSLFACFEEDDDDKEEEARVRSSSALAAACAEAAATAAAKEEDEREAAAATAAADASSDESDVTGLAGRRMAASASASDDSSLDLMLATTTSESESDGEEDGAAPVSSPHKKRGRECSKEEERASKAPRLELFTHPQAVCC